MKANNKLQIRNSTAEFLIFANQNGADGIEVRFQDGTIWFREVLKTTIVMLNLFQHPIIFRGLRVKPAMTKRQKTEFIEVPLSQKLMGVLFETTSDNIGLHLKNIFNDNELSENSVTEIFSATASDGKNYQIKHYNLDAIIAVGYRVNSRRAMAFRQWATAVLRDFAIRGYVIDRKRMENGTFTPRHCGLDISNRHCGLVVVRHCGLDPQSPIERRNVA